jgi:rhodanese-related sulfurtransferase
MKSIIDYRFKIAAITVLMLVYVFAVPQVFADKEYKTVPTDQLKVMLDKKQAFILIDARTKQEYKNAHIFKAINIPDKKLKENISLLPTDKNALLIIYCNGVKCGKSKRLAQQLEPMGYGNIMIYSEGIPVWEERNLPIFVGPDYEKKVDTSKLKPADIQKMIREKKTDYILVDVRDPSEYEEGHIPTSINIPAETFASRSGILPKNKKIIVTCNTGSRSYLAYRKLIQLAYPNIYQTLIADWKDAGLPLER